MHLVRLATLDDARAIAHVQVASWQSAYRCIVAEETLDQMSEDDRALRWNDILQRPEQVTFVAEEDARGILGFANGGPEREGREGFDGELYAIYVLPDCTGQGIGRRLVGAFSQWLLVAGRRTMIVWVLAENPFRGFYERLGGSFLASEVVVIGERKLTKVAYGWSDVHALIADAAS